MSGLRFPYSNRGPGSVAYYAERRRMERINQKWREQEMLDGLHHPRDEEIALLHAALAKGPISAMSDVAREATFPASPYRLSGVRMYINLKEGI